MSGLTANNPSVIAAASNKSFYQDNPGGSGSGTYAESFPVVPMNWPLFRLLYLRLRIDFPAAVGESAIIRLYRYRKTGPAGAFTYTQVTDSYTVTDATPWSWTLDLSANIRDFSFDPVTDSIAVSNVYTAGGAPSMRALRVDFALRPSDD